VTLIFALPSLGKTGGTTPFVSAGGEGEGDARRLERGAVQPCRPTFRGPRLRGAATPLAGIVEQGGARTQLLLARAYYHSDQRPHAEETARAVLARAPSEAYPHLLLGRVLQRQNRAAEAIGSLRLAAVMDPRLAEFAVA